MVTWFVRAKQSIVLVGLSFALLLAGAVPILGGLEVDAARKERRAKGAGSAGAEAIQSFANPAGIAIPTGQIATLYPSTIEVSGLAGEITDVAVTLHRFSHSAPDGVDMLLVGPEGQTAIIVSDAGGLNPVSNVTFTLDDQAPNLLPAQLTNGTFKPTNFPHDADTFPAPAPTPQTDNEELHRFNGTDPNGAWSLYIVDNDASNSGVLNDGWSLLITTENSDPQAAPDQFRVKAGKTLSVGAPGVLANDSDPDGDPLTAVLATKPRKGKLSLQPDGSFTYKAKKKAKGKDQFTYLAQDLEGDDGLGTVTIKIKKSKKGKKGKK